MTDIFYKFISSLIAMFTQPASRFFLPYLASAVLFAWGALFLQTKGKGTGAALRHALGPKILFHRSAIADYQLILLNMLVDILGAGLLLIGVTALAHGGAGALASVFGPSPHWTASFLAAAVFTVATVTANDFANFSFHWMQHRNKLLWELHKVHHAAEVLTPLTAIRVHPLANFIGIQYLALFQGLISAAFLYCYDSPVAQIEILGVNALTVLANTLFAGHLAHMQVWVMFPKFLQGVLYSPALHLIHHSGNPRHYDTNYGFLFSFWDRLFGTLYQPTQEDRDNLRLGVAPEDMAELRTVPQLYWTPLRNICRICAKAILAKTGKPAVEPGE
jgi:sterol desaturase/sphingolipid hydroxylase (fatty acid hydroxylase superfamily)